MQFAGLSEINCGCKLPEDMSPSSAVRETQALLMKAHVMTLAVMLRIAVRNAAQQVHKAQNTGLFLVTTYMTRRIITA